MKTIHEWLAEQRAMREGLWLNNKLAQPGMSNVNPLLQKKPKAKNTAQPKPTMPSIACAAFRPFKAAFPATLKPKS